MLNNVCVLSFTLSLVTVFLFVCLFYLLQETDASLLMITGFPAFAVSDESLCKQAKSIVLERLEVRS